MKRWLVMVCGILGFVLMLSCGSKPPLEPDVSKVTSSVAVEIEDHADCPLLQEADFGACVISGAGALLPELSVYPEDTDSISVYARDVSAELAPFGASGCAAVRIRGRLEFVAVADHPALHPRQVLPAISSGIVVSPDSRIERILSVEEAELIANIQLGMGVIAEGVRLRCSDLALDDPFRQVEGVPLHSLEAGRWRPAGISLRLADGPFIEPTLRIITEKPEWLPLLERDRRGQAVLVQMEWLGGARLSGWVNQSEVLPAESRTFARTGGHGELPCGPLGACGGSEAVFCGSADIALGTTVYAEPGRGPWAKIADSDGLEVVAVEGEPWVQLKKVPGITEGDRCSELQHAWVAREAVQLPGE